MTIDADWDVISFTNQTKKTPQNAHTFIAGFCVFPSKQLKPGNAYCTGSTRENIPRIQLYPRFDVKYKLKKDKWNLWLLLKAILILR